MKPQRNDPCPCGSGKKYKKCCLAKESDQVHGDSAWSHAGKIHRIQHADDYPVETCYLNADWKERGLACIVVTRSQENGKNMLGAFLVDTSCLGVKNAFCNEGLGRRRIEDQLLPRYYQNEEPTRVGINYVKEIIYGAVDYAKSLGFDPHPDFELSRHMLGPEEINRTRDLKFGGAEGKPLYIAGPDDDAATILQKLRQRLGKDGFHFIAPEADWEAIEDDEDSEPGFIRRIWSRTKKGPEVGSG